MTQPPKEGAGCVEQGPNDLPWVSSVGSLRVSVSHLWPTAHEEADKTLLSRLGSGHSQAWCQAPALLLVPYPGFLLGLCRPYC